MIGKASFAAQPYSKAYEHTYTSTGETIDLTQLVPGDCKHADYSFVTGSSEIGGAGSTIVLKSVNNGLLTFELGEMTSYTDNTYKTFKVKVASDNYEDFELLITIKRTECTHPTDSLKEEIVKQPECLENGYKNIVCGKCHKVMEENIVIPPIGHSYGEPVFTWSEDYSSATATFTCSRSSCEDSENGHSVTVDAMVTSDVADGIITYTASASYKGVSGTDKVMIKVMAENARFVITIGMKEIPQTLLDAGYTTEEAIKNAMVEHVLKNKGYTAENTVLYDVEFQVSLDGGVTWVKATQENFPEEGCTVTLPYPEGTNRSEFDFIVAHMLTSEMNGLHPGDIENPKVVKSEDGIRITVKSLSPIAVSWKSVSEQDDGERPITTETTTKATTAVTKATVVSTTASAATKTGDPNTIWIWVAGLIIGFGAMGATVILRRKKEKVD